jgi:hypothetical protein
MPRPKKRYVDAQGVFRGYYVYLHRAIESGEVFYVGKGSGNRAWQRTNRNSEWNEKVSALGDRWEVVIVKDDLSEIEAFKLEARVVEEHGGPGSTGGKLINQIPGGEEFGGSITLDRGPADRVWTEACRNARRFRELPRETQERLVKQLQIVLKPIGEAAMVIDEATIDAHDEIFDASILGNMLISLYGRCRDLLSRRISWSDFALRLESNVDYLTSEPSENYRPQVWDLAVKAAAELTKLFNEIDSGNRKEAKDAADKASLVYSQSLEKGD